MKNNYSNRRILSLWLMVLVGLLVENFTASAAFTGTDIPILKAAESGDIKEVGRLIDRGVSVESKNKDGWTALMFAAKSGSLDMVDLLVAKGANVNERSSTEAGSTVLCFAAENGKLSVILTLLEHGANPNANSRIGTRPLAVAAMSGWSEVVDLLLSKGADMNGFGAIDNRGNRLTPLMGAANKGKIEIVQLLIKAGALIELKNNAGDTALMEVSKRPYPAIVKLLIDAGAKVNAAGPKGHTALIYAAYNGQVENLKLLLSFGADPFAKATDDEMPDESSQWYDAVSLAKQQRHPEALSIVRAAQVRHGSSGNKP